MTQLDKLISKFLSDPPSKNLTYDQATTVLLRLGSNKTQAKGSHVKFYHPKLSSVLILHKPHPNNKLKKYQLSDIKNFITKILL